MAMRKWEPFSELVSLRQAMDRLFEDSFVHPSRFFAAFGEPTMPAVDAYQTPNEVVVKAALPGIKPEDVDIDITGDTLTIRGGSQGGERSQAAGLFLSGAALWRLFSQFDSSWRAPSG